MKKECFKDNEHKTPGVVYCSGNFSPNGAGAIPTTAFHYVSNPTGLCGRGYSVVRQGTGQYRVTVPGSFRSVVATAASVQLAASPGASSVDVYWTAVSGGTPATSAFVFDVFYRVAGVATDLTLSAGNRIHFECELEAGR